MTVRRWAASMLLVLILIKPAAAQEPKAIEVSLIGHASFTTASDLENDRGRVAIHQTGAVFEYSHFSLDYQTSFFSWSKKSRLPFGNQKDDPWKSLSKLGFNLNYNNMTSERWGYLVGGRLSSNFEKEMTDSLVGSAWGGIIYVISPTWQVRAGLGGFLDSIDGQLFPLVGLDYNRAAVTGFSFSLGLPESELIYGFSDKLAAKLNLLYDLGTYRLADNNAVPKKGYLRYQWATAGMALDYRPIENLSISAGPEVHFMRKFTTYNQDRKKVGSYDLDPSLGAQIKIEYRF